MTYDRRSTFDVASWAAPTRRWWGDGCHRAPAFAGAPREALPATDRLADRVLGLPLHAALSVEDIEYLVACVGEVLASDGDA